MIRGYLQDLKHEFKGYNSAKFSKDLLAGLTVTAVALPLALAFGVSSGATAASGLITAVIAGLLMSATAGAFYQISGPTGAMAAILLSLVAQYGMQGVFVAGFLAGVFLVIAGLLHMGRLTAFIPMPVVTGFTSGIAIIIVLGQLDNLFGVVSVGDTNIEKLLSYAELGFSPNPTTLAIGILVAVFMVVFPKKWSAIVPASLIGIILATAATIIFNLDTAMVGEIPQTLLPDTRLRLSEISISQISGLLAPAASIAMLAMIESLLCGASAGRMTGVHLKSDNELISQGIGNMVVPFFGGIPATAAIARTSVAIKSGAQTRIAGIIHGVGLLISMLVLAPIMSKIPLSALSGVLIITAWRMNEWDTIKKIFRGHFKGAIAKFLVTMFATIIFDLTVAIMAGVVLALLLLAARLSNLDIAYDRVDMSRMDVDDDNLIKRYSNTMAVYITGAMIFANTDQLEEIPNRLDGCDTLLLSMRGVSELDISSGQVMYELIESMQEAGVDVMFCGLSAHVTDMMHRTKISELVGEDSFYWSANYALGEIHRSNAKKILETK